MPNVCDPIGVQPSADSAVPDRKSITAAKSLPAIPPAPTARRLELTDPILARRQVEPTFMWRPVLMLTPRGQERRAIVVEYGTGPEVPASFSPVLYWPDRRRRSEIVQRVLQQRKKAHLLVVPLVLCRAPLSLSCDSLTLKLVDRVVGVANPFFSLGGMGLGFGDLVDDVLHPLDEILQCGRWKRERPDPVP
jgi:hypothetical protein